MILLFGLPEDVWSEEHSCYSYVHTCETIGSEHLTLWVSPGKTDWTMTHLPNFGSLCTDFQSKDKLVHQRSFFSIFPLEPQDLNKRRPHNAASTHSMQDLKIEWSGAVSHPDDVCCLDGFIICELDGLVNIGRFMSSIRACRMVYLRIFLCAYAYNVEINTSLLSRFA